MPQKSREAPTRRGRPIRRKRGGGGSSAGQLQGVGGEDQEDGWKEVPLPADQSLDVSQQPPEHWSSKEKRQRITDGSGGDLGICDEHLKPRQWSRLELRLDGRWVCKAAERCNKARR